MENVLIATLGESPVVVTAMYDLLTKQAQKQIDRLVVLYSEGGMVKEACDLVEEAMRDQPCVIEWQDLSITDVNTTRDCMIFLQKLYQRLTIHQANGDTVYLSLAGGRKSMSALMAWAIPYFSCIQGLYHVIDVNEQDFWTVEQLFGDLSTGQRQRAMHPPLNLLRLVNIPLDSDIRIRDDIRNRLATMTDEELDDLLEKNAEQAAAIQFGRNIAQGERILNVMFTEYAADQFRKMRKYDVTHAQSFEICFGDMRTAAMLRTHVHHEESGKGPSAKTVVYHYFKRHRTPERPVFYTLPKDIKNANDSEVNDVIVCALEIERERKYRSIPEIQSTPKFSPEAAVSLDSLLSIKYRKENESVLVIPLGMSPMIATQLYMLLKEQANIREIILIYPSSQEIINGAELVKRALKEENGPPCRQIRIPGISDIDTSEACKKFVEALESEIDDIQKKRYQVLLALTGGRKEMAALAMFVAMRKRIPYLYHTLISNDALEKRIMKETTVRELNRPGLDKQLRNDRLFLRAYANDNKEKLAKKFTLFTVPVLLPL